MSVLIEALRKAVILVMIWVFALRAIASGEEKSHFGSLVLRADAVVAVEILSTDYSATPADGPMVAVAKVLKVVKGTFAKGHKFRFTETAWVGPTYKKNEYRLLFLEAADSSQRSTAKSWRILSHLCAKLDFFIEKDSIPKLSLQSLESFLREIQDSKRRPAKIVFGKSTSK